MKKSELPCVTCRDICGNAVNLYTAYHARKASGSVITKMGLKCPKAGQVIEVDFKEVSNAR